MRGDGGRGVTDMVHGGPSALGVDWRREDDLVLLDVAGELELSTVDTLREAVDTALAAPDCTGVLVDLTELGFCDSTGITALVCARAQAAACGRSFGVVGAHGMVRRVLEVAGVLDALTAPNRHVGR